MKNRPYFFNLWNFISNFGRLKGYDFEIKINTFFKKNDFMLLNNESQIGKKYVKGKSGVYHEVDLLAYSTHTRELVIGECKSSRRIKTNEVINFVYKCDDVLDILVKKFEPLILTKLFFSLYPFPLDGYRICWYNGIIPFEFSIDSAPIFLLDKIFVSRINEIIFNHFCDPQKRKMLIEKYNEISKNIKKIMKNINFFQEYDWKHDRNMKNDFNNMLNNVDEIDFNLKQIEMYKEPIYNVLIKEIISNKIKTRRNYVWRKRYFMHKINEKVDRINDYKLIKRLLIENIPVNKISKIMPTQYLHTKIILDILNKNISKYIDYVNLLKKHSIKDSKIDQYHYKLITPALFLLNQDDVKTFFNFIIKILNTSFLDLHFTLCRHIIKSLLRKDILNSIDFYNYIQNINNIINMPWDINEYDIVKYAKSPELDYLHKLIPFYVSSRYLADLIINDEIIDLDTYNQYKDYLVNIFWLDADLDYLSVIYSSPITTKIRDFFISNGIDIIHTRRIYYPKYSKITAFLDIAIDIIKNDITRDVRICDFCGLYSTEHFKYLAGISYYLCDECYKHFFDDI